MEKISLYDLLTILLPGALLTLIIQLIFKDLGLKFVGLEVDQYFALTIFLSSSIFLGSSLNFLTEKLLSKLRKVGLFTEIETLYPKIKQTPDFVNFYNTMVKNDLLRLKAAERHEVFEELWSKIYYYLEANEKITTPKAFQSFYFFFRNFFILGFLLIIPFGVLIFVFSSPEKYILLSIINLLAVILSIYAGRWNRFKMVERMFWTYYMLKSENK